MAYYDEAGLQRLDARESGAPVLKAQHPEFEMWNQGIHARTGVACADCHMPYMREGALKISDHHVRSPLLNINRACQTCHKWPEEELRTARRRSRSAPSTCATSRWTRSSGSSPTSKAAKAAGPHRRASCSGAWRLQRQAQFRLDFVEAENSTGFHAPEEAARILGESIDFARQGQVLLRDPAFKPQHAPGGMGEPTPPGERGKGN